MALVHCLLASFLVIAVGHWSTGFSAGNFRVQNPAAAFGDGEWWIFGGRGVETDGLDSKLEPLLLYDVFNIYI